MIKLPKYTFLNGPTGSGKTTLRSLLCMQDPDLCPLAFADPIRMALLATFYPDDLYSPGSRDLTNNVIAASPLPLNDITGNPMSHREWILKFGKFMRQEFGSNIFGILAKRTCEQMNVHFPRFVFDGLRTEGDLEPFDSKDSLIIQVYRPGTSWVNNLGGWVRRAQAIPVLLINNDGPPEQMLKALERGPANATS